MKAHDIRPDDIFRYGAYLCLHVPASARREAARVPIPGLAERMGLRSEFESQTGHPPEAIAFLRRTGATPAQIEDDDLLHADAVIHVASGSMATVSGFLAEAATLLAGLLKPVRHRGVVRPTIFTGNLMHNFAYGEQLLQQPGVAAPNAFIVPMSKSSEWWAKDWMERHTYLLPRYEEGRMVAEGHALAAAAGVPYLMRRTYKHEPLPAPPGGYDFVTYFECADADVPMFHSVCAALRDVSRNPEWKYVREGPTWQGRRVATWSELFV